MIVTEAEAKTKRCQESFGDRHTTKDGQMICVDREPRGGDRDFPLMSSPSFCVGSACMAWRWHKRTVGEANAGTGRGYCGKAGIIE